MNTGLELATPGLISAASTRRLAQMQLLFHNSLPLIPLSAEKNNVLL